MAPKDKSTPQNKKNQRSKDIEYNRANFATARHASNIQKEIDIEDERKRTTTLINGHETWQKFWIIKPCTPGELEGMSVFIVQKYLEHNIGHGLNTKKIRKTGNLLVEVNNAKQADRIRRNEQIHGTLTRSEPHRSLNVRKGVVRSPDLRGMDDDVLLDEWSEQGVSDVKRIFAFRDGEKKPTDSLIVTFDLQTLPKELTAGYLRLPVSLYVPQPLRCYHCQKYGHHKSQCKNKPACQVCSGEGHDDRTCGNKPHCRNCGEDHAPSSKACSKWVQEKEICKIKTEQNISYPEARKLCRLQTDVTNRLSYAKAAAIGSAVGMSASSVQTATKSTQTETATQATQTETELPQPNTQKTNEIATQTEDPTELQIEPSNSSENKSETKTKHTQQQKVYKPGPKFTKSKDFITPPTTPRKASQKRSIDVLSPEPEGAEAILQANKFHILSSGEDKIDSDGESEVELEIDSNSDPPSESENDS